MSIVRPKMFKCPDCGVDYGDNEHTPWYCEETGRYISSDEAIQFNGQTYAQYYGMTEEELKRLRGESQ